MPTDQDSIQRRDAARSQERQLDPNCMFPVNRRSAIKTIGAGMVGGAAMVGKVAGGNHGTFELLRFPPEDLTEGNISANDEGATVMLEGAGSFDPRGDGPASGGGTFEFRDADGDVVARGEWDAVTTEHFDEFGRLSDGQVGGHLELSVTLSTGVGTNPLGDGPGHELHIFCMIGYDPDKHGHTTDPHKAEEGFDLDSYTERVDGATLFNLK